jgi:hypothetical protein
MLCNAKAQCKGAGGMTSGTRRLREASEQMDGAVEKAEEPPDTGPIVGCHRLCTSAAMYWQRLHVRGT